VVEATPLDEGARSCQTGARVIIARPTILRAAISLTATLAVLLVRDVRTISRREETGASTVTEGAPA
jgi:hypothetical protein